MMIRAAQVAIVSLILLLALAFLSLAAAQIDAVGGTIQGRSVGGSVVSGKPDAAGGGPDVGSSQSCLPTCDYYLGQSLIETITPLSTGVSSSRTSTYTLGWSSGGGNAAIGRFVDGSYWVAPAPGQTSVSLDTATGSDSITADEQPDLDAIGLLDGSQSYGNHDPSQNLLTSLPVVKTTDTSITFAIQRNEPLSSNCGPTAVNGECIDSIFVVTVLAAIPTDYGKASIRPPINGQYRSPVPLTAFDFSRLPSLAYMTGTDAAGLATIATRWRYNTEAFSVWASSNGGYSEGGRAYRSHILTDEYGAGTAQQFVTDLATITSSSNTYAEKEEALAAMLVYGLDTYASIFDNPGKTRYFGSGAGQSTGKFLPSAFAAALLVSDVHMNTLATVSGTMDATHNWGFQEIEQANIHFTSTPVWGDFRDIQHLQGYWSSLLNNQCYDGAAGVCGADPGKKTQFDPYGYIDGPAEEPGTQYFVVSHAAKKALVGFMCVMPRIADAVNYDALITYVDRVQSTGVKTLPDVCAPPDPRENLVSCTGGGIWGTQFNTGDNPATWQASTGCAYIGETWGPDPTDVSLCITNNQSPNTGQNGRFPARNGAVPSFSYTSAQIETNFTTMRGVSTTCRTGS